MNKFYCFDQNNSGGSFVTDELAGIGEYVFIEASSAEDAISRAEDIGLYFGGEGDCPCCGDRWYRPLDDDGTEMPLVYEKPWVPVVGVDRVKQGMWNLPSYIHYHDGTFVAAKPQEIV